MTDLVEIGVITGVHGVKGFIKIRLKSAQYAHLGMPLLLENERKITLKNPVKGQYLAEIDGVSDRTDAEQFKSASVFTHKSDFETLAPLHSLLGYKIFNSSNEYEGEIVAIQNFGAGDLIEIAPEHGVTILAPAKDIKSTDTDTKTLILDIDEAYKS